MTDAIKRYDDARRAFLGEVRAITTDVQRQANAALNKAEEHDYLLYLATCMGALGQAVACHNIMSFEDWKRDFCGGHKHCSKAKSLEEV